MKIRRNNIASKNKLIKNKTMKKIYLSPRTRWVDMGADEPMLVVVSGTSGNLSDGTEIGDGGEDDGEVISAVKGNTNIWDSEWE